jgi:hypothetical protein
MVAPTLRDAALAYARRGWPVIPLHHLAAKAGAGCSCPWPDCGSAGKHPRTVHGLKDASTDPDQIRRWWTRWPKANIGVVTGKASGFIVLDIDPYHAGDLTLSSIRGVAAAISCMSIQAASSATMPARSSALASIFAAMAAISWSRRACMPVADGMCGKPPAARTISPSPRCPAGC